METDHAVVTGDARELALPADSVDLVVTSPPYPMIEMWDEVFAALDPTIEDALDAGDGQRAFEAMHDVLDAVWEQLERVLVDGGIVAINVGDATRTLDRFRQYPNVGEITRRMTAHRFDPLPDIVWRKPGNSAAKFMGSGMVPPNAYPTLEHESILLFRNGSRRSFPPGDETRYESAYFWEERNRWFSDVWTDVRGARQEREDRQDHGREERDDGAGNTSARAGGDDRAVGDGRASDDVSAAASGGEAVDRDRTAAYPFEIPYRLVCMHSLYGDTVLDPFLGTGTTTLAAMVAGRDSVGYELDPEIVSMLDERVADLPERSRRVVSERLAAHRRFVEAARADGTAFDYEATHYDFPVRTRQERDIRLRVVEEVAETEEGYRVEYEPAAE